METDTAIEGPPPPFVPLFGKRRAPTFRIALPPLPKVGTGNYYALGAVTLFLAVFGLVMVLSASSVEQGQDLGNPYADFGKQAVAEGLGIAAMLLVSRARPRLLLVSAPWVFAAAIVLQLLTVLTPLGTTVNGNRNWIRIAGTSIQPSEFVKLGLVLVLGAFFARKRGERLGVPGVAPVRIPSGLAIVSVLLGKDLGTSLIIGGIVFAGLFFAGVRVPVLLLFGGSAGL